MTPLLKFFLLTYALTWTCFITAAALSSSAGPLGPVPAAFLMPLLYLGTFAPSLVALGLTARAEGLAASQALLRRVLDSEAAARWYVFAISYVAAIKLTVAVVYRLGTGSWPRFGSEPWYVIAAAIVISTPVQAGEEIGWRGYALPRLVATFGLARASLVLGLIWGIWHLPLFFTNGSLLLVMLMHSAANQTNGIVPTRLANPGNPFALDTSLVTVLTGVLLGITTGYLLIRMRHIRFSAPALAR